MFQLPKPYAATSTEVLLLGEGPSSSPGYGAGVLVSTSGSQTLSFSLVLAIASSWWTRCPIPLQWIMLQAPPQTRRSLILRRFPRFLSADHLDVLRQRETSSNPPVRQVTTLLLRTTLRNSAVIGLAAHDKNGCQLLMCCFEPTTFNISSRPRG